VFELGYSVALVYMMRHAMIQDSPSRAATFVRRSAFVGAFFNFAADNNCAVAQLPPLLCLRWPLNLDFAMTRLTRCNDGETEVSGVWVEEEQQ
jgi:hypothetical protein